MSTTLETADVSTEMFSCRQVNHSAASVAYLAVMKKKWVSSL